MPDDIVARLRTCRICANSGMLDTQPCPRCANSIQREAADEIERLRRGLGQTTTNHVGGVDWIGVKPKEPK